MHLRLTHLKLKYLRLTQLKLKLTPRKLKLTPRKPKKLKRRKTLLLLLLASVVIRKMLLASVVIRKMLLANAATRKMLLRKKPLLLLQAPLSNRVLRLKKAGVSPAFFICCPAPSPYRSRLMGRASAFNTDHP